MSMFRTRTVSTATAIAVAVFSMVLVAWLATGPGVSIAKWAEIHLQRALPGGWPDTVVEREWSTPGSLNAMGLLAYEERPEQAFALCLPGAVGMVALASAAALCHLAVCAAVSRLWGIGRGAARDEQRAQRSRLFRRSILATLPLLVGYAVIRWVWAGAARGSITQRVVGGEHVEIAFGPFGRFALVAGVFVLYLSIVSLTAALARRQASTPAPAQSQFVAPSLLLVAGFFLVAFPYLAPQCVRLLSVDSAMKLGQWSEQTPVRDVFDAIAPFP
jgi:hypothetical protein